ncbi:MAG: hypothetical protein P1U56_16405 [Saprospiraceae bacterium]|nr:hypothetical protein [Saprospiraceae bacterium]
MKVKNLLFCALFFCCMLGIQPLNAQLVEEASITANEANFKMISPNSYLMEIAGPNDYYFRQEIESTNTLSLSNVDTNGKKFPDGTYKMQVTPIVTLSETTRQELADLRKENDPEKMAAFRLEHELPAEVNVYNISFSIRNGQFVTPDDREVKGISLPSTSMIWEQDHPVLYASLNSVDMEYGKPTLASNALPLVGDNTLMNEDDQVFLDDVIVDGSICVGQDCVNGESFGFDTGRYKENNLRIHFNDTSNSASFPTNDWRITINDSSNGGSNYFAVEDASAGNVPFRVEAGAGANALHVDAGGEVGLGTANPVVELHMADGDSPTMRLEQNGTSGFTPQTWDVAGNEANFFVRDVTNGSKLPFKIKPNAPTSSIFIEGTTGDIGLGTESPDAALDVEQSDGSASIFVTELNGTTAARTLLNLTNNGGPSIGMINSSTGDQWFLNHENSSPNRFLIVTSTGAGAVFALTNTGDLDISGTLTTGGVTCGGGCDLVFQPAYTVPSIEDHAAFMWKNSYLKAVGPTPEGAPMNVSEKVGGILNELEHAHIYIEQLNNEIKTQTEKIENLEAQIAKMETLETQLAELSKLVSTLNKTNDSSDEAVGEKE